MLFDSVYGITHKPRMCAKKTLTTELVFLFHILITTYSVLSPFVLKDYISNLMFNSTMLLSWVLIKKVHGEPICILSVLEDVMCENNRPIRIIPTSYIVMTIAVMLYDIYMLLRA